MSKSLLILSAFLLVSKAYKVVLINPFLGQSHVNFVTAVADSLVEGGHTVVRFCLFLRIPKWASRRPLLGVS